MGRLGPMSKVQFTPVFTTWRRYNSFQARCGLLMAYWLLCGKYAYLISPQIQNNISIPIVIEIGIGTINTISCAILVQKVTF